MIEKEAANLYDGDWQRMWFPSPCGEMIEKVYSYKQVKKAILFPSPCGEMIEKDESTFSVLGDVGLRFHPLAGK